MPEQAQCNKHFCSGRVKYSTKEEAEAERVRRGVCNRIITQCEDHYHIEMLPPPRPLRVDAPY